MRNSPKLDPKRRQRMVARMVASDMVALIEDAKRGDFDLMVAILTCNGSKPAGAMTDAELIQEWHEGEYDGPKKDTYIRGTETFKQHEFIRNAWEKGEL